MLKKFPVLGQDTHKRGLNSIRVKAVPSRYAALQWTLGALALAVIVGLLMRAFAPEALCRNLNDTFLIPIRTIFMNGLKMCAPAVVFFSIAACLAQYGNLAEVRRVGGRLMLCFFLTQILAMGVGLGISALFRPGSGATLEAAAMTQGAAPSPGEAVAIKDTLVNFMPSNLVRPFLEGNMPQLIVLAIFVGTAVGATGARTWQTVLEEGNDTFMRITAMLMRFIPLVVFCAIASLCLTTGGAMLLAIMGVLGTILAGYLGMTAVFWLMTAFIGRLNPARLFAKCLPVMATALSTSSANAAIPDSMRASERMGISPKVYSLSIPLGTSVNKSGLCVYLVVAALALARIYGVAVSAASLISLGVSILILVMAMPGLPGGGVVGLSILMAQMGGPIEAVGLMIGVEPVIDMFRTVCNCLGTLTATLIVAAREGLLDTARYNSD